MSNSFLAYEIIENPRNLRFRFTLCMQEFFDSIPQHQWKIEDPTFIKQSEEFEIKVQRLDNRTDYLILIQTSYANHSQLRQPKERCYIYFSPIC
ncbi:MAG: hypothetical protein WAM14_09345 [Candidatus Nitrosopolaris sp.]